jgi:integral membrane protein
MSPLLKTKIGRLRVLSLVEGCSLLLLVFIGVPFKYFLHIPILVKILGPIHGVLFLLLIFMTISASIEAGWKFTRGGAIILASVIPFGCFYVENSIFKKLPA